MPVVEGLVFAGYKGVKLSGHAGGREDNSSEVKLP